MWLGMGTGRKVCAQRQSLIIKSACLISSVQVCVYCRVCVFLACEWPMSTAEPVCVRPGGQELVSLHISQHLKLCVHAWSSNRERKSQSVFFFWVVVVVGGGVPKRGSWLTPGIMMTPGIQAHLTLINWPGVPLSLHWATWQRGRPQDSTTPQGMIRLLTSVFLPPWIVLCLC